MTLFEQCTSICRAAAIQQGAKIERTPDEVVADILFAEPLLVEAKEILEDNEVEVSA